MKKVIILIQLLPCFILAQSYDFEKDQNGLAPANITAVNGLVKVSIHSTEGKSMEGLVAGSGSTAVANMDLFPAARNYSIIWKETYTVARRSGFILRANGSNSITTGLMKGYLFQVNSSTNNVRIYKSNASSFTLLSSESLTAPGVNSPRWYKATVNDNDLILDYSNDGMSFTNLITTTDNTYNSGKVQYSIGFGKGSGNLYVDDIKFLSVENNSITINNISPYQVFQRDHLGKADLFIEGNYKGNPSGIEARWSNSEIWTSLSLNTNGQGTFSGSLKNQNQGQGTLWVRFSDNISVTIPVRNVGIGDIYVIAGQSNASGRGETYNSYAHPILKAIVFGNDYTWKELTDPVDSNVGQIDHVSSDGAAKGSPWPFIATRIMQSQNVPVAFIPAAKGGSSILQWQPDQDHSNPNTLYGSMNQRIKDTGGKVKGVLFFQGERDAVSNTSEVNYEKRLNTFVSTIASDFPGLKVLTGQIGHANNMGLNAVRKAQLKVINSNQNALLGPATYDINLSDENGDFLHFKSDKDMSEYARRWFMAINEAFYFGDNGYGPIVDKDSITYNHIFNKITVPFNDAKFRAIHNESSVSPDSFKLKNNGLVSISSININGNVLEIIPSSILDISKPIWLSYGLLNDGVSNAIYDNEKLPAQNFYDVLVQIEQTGNETFGTKNNYLIYPNPTKDELFIAFGFPINQVKVKIYSSMQIEVLSKSIIVDKDLIRLNISKLKAGIYSIFIDTKEGTISKKIVKN
ncbi:sialate O-acetylesterase [uncultured Aquimarina sp.]|uniref:T9SS type A sorting domain-containing protein n=1 Tax=uncultured Aquimarina sp. TaxID=575652 RepID=UPI0026127D81|nr:sialate O-acetylesterase [uncultured Aquimarina sp.]